MKQSTNNTTRCRVLGERLPTWIKLNWREGNARVMWIIKPSDVVQWSNGMEAIVHGSDSVGWELKKWNKERCCWQERWGMKSLMIVEQAGPIIFEAPASSEALSDPASVMLRIENYRNKQREWAVEGGGGYVNDVEDRLFWSRAELPPQGSSFHEWPSSFSLFLSQSLRQEANWR